METQKQPSERKFKCEECDKSYSKSYRLKRHKNMHLKKWPHTCVECGKGYNSSDQLEDHMRTHTGERPFQCPKCEKTFRMRKGLKRHKLTHTGTRPYQCKECGNSYYDSSTLNIHKRKHTGERPYRCVECGKNYPSLNSLTFHKKSHAREQDFKCARCGKAFPYKLHEHKFTISGPSVCKDCGGDGVFTCDECGKIFNSSALLKKHMAVHELETPCKCDQCHEVFSCEKWLKRHMSRTHTKPITCKDCGSGFFEAYSLKLHLRNLNDETYCCNLCEKPFQSAECLQNHSCSQETKKAVSGEKRKKKVYKPLGEKKYKCGQCGEEFHRKEQLNKHTLVHTKPNKCEDCGTGFFESYSLKLHLRSEEMYQCSQCEKPFKSKECFQNHGCCQKGKTIAPSQPFVIDKEGPFSCDHCFEEFSRWEDLNRHRSVHSKPIKCPDCGSGFFESYSLKLHLRSAHDEEVYRCDRCAKRFKSKECFEKHKCTDKIVTFCEESGKALCKPLRFQEHEARQTGAGSSKSEANIRDSSCQQKTDTLQQKTAKSEGDCKERIFENSEIKEETSEIPHEVNRNIKKEEHSESAKHEANHEIKKEEHFESAKHEANHKIKKEEYSESAEHEQNRKIKMEEHSESAEYEANREIKTEAHSSEDDDYKRTIVEFTDFKEESYSSDDDDCLEQETIVIANVCSLRPQ